MFPILDFVALQSPEIGTILTCLLCFGSQLITLITQSEHLFRQLFLIYSLLFDFSFELGIPTLVLIKNLADFFNLLCGHRFELFQLILVLLLQVLRDKLREIRSVMHRGDFNSLRLNLTTGQYRTLENVIIAMRLLHSSF